MPQVVRVSMPNGDVVWARVTTDDEDDHGPRDVGFGRDAAVRKLEGLVETVRGVTEVVHTGLAGLGHDDVTIQFGVELSAMTGKVVSVLAEGGGKASISVTVTWKGPSSDPDGEPSPR